MYPGNDPEISKLEYLVHYPHHLQNKYYELPTYILNNVVEIKQPLPNQIFFTLSGYPCLEAKMVMHNGTSAVD